MKTTIFSTLICLLLANTEFVSATCDNVCGCCSAFIAQKNGPGWYVDGWLHTNADGSCYCDTFSRGCGACKK
ncbi:unnamed protein product [Cercospora beticola]|nr:unnamed protein product [Cercospora beticola]